MKLYTVAIFLVFISFSLEQVHAINPAREYILNPDSVGWNYEQLLIKTMDGYQLNSWIYEANKKNDKDTVLILAYPDAGNMSYFVYHSAVLADAGFTVVTFDYRGFGESDDFEIQREYLYYTEFALDLEAVVDSISLKFQNKKIGILGMSMGTTIASRAYPEIKNQIDFIVGEGFVTDPPAIVNYYKGKGKSILLPEDPELYLESVQSIACPMLILTASNDEVTTASAAFRLQKILGATCQSTIYEGQHLTGFQVDYDDKGFGGWYIEQLENFLENV
ncbi:alpha/beta hydrolase [Algoriphagus sp.]|uniref:alpha/beta hydrolase n=1 Tax=Algoriphagus sp. TaxID=1872435 RepID=UPI003F72CCAC